MHYRFLVTTNKENAETSAEARDYVNDYLTDNGFVYQEGRWGGGHADWFVIGGRWSGELSRHSWAKALYEKIHEWEEAEDIQVWGAFYGDIGKQERQKELAVTFNEWWHVEAPTEYRDVPFCRNTYNPNGYEDDAMLLTQELYDALLKEYEGADTDESYCDLEYEVCSPDMIGNKWLVVVDYHN